jgi:hypothetical protein
MPRSPQADLWLKLGSAIGQSYSVAIVPVKLKAVYLSYFGRRRHVVRVAAQGVRSTSLQRILHPQIFKDLEAQKAEFIRMYPHTEGIFDGLHYFVINRNNSRPISRDFDEKEFMKDFFNVAKTPPAYPNGYATAVYYNIGNGVTTTMPILVLQVNVQLEPVHMAPLG